MSALLAPVPTLLALAALQAAEPAPPTPASPALEKPVFVPAETERLRVVFAPFRTDAASLSPDGRYLAYTVRQDGQVEVVVVPVDEPGTLKARVLVVTDETATAMLTQNTELTPGAVRWMRWATADRLVVETNRVAVNPDASWSVERGEILAFNADGSDARTLVTPRDVAVQVAPDAARFNPQRDDSFLQPGRLRAYEQINALIDENRSLFDTPSADGELFTTPAAGFNVTPRSPQVVDFVAGTPGELLVQAGAGPRIQLYQLHATSGKLTPQAPWSVPDGHAWLPDRQGRPRLTLPVSGTATPPLPYRVDNGAALLSWKRVDELLDLTPDDRGAFEVGPEAWFDHRAIPLGFDENPDVLYYASNVGRDTFGLYAFNVRTGQRGGLQVEHPRYDLIDPAPAGFPSGRTLVFDRHTRALAGVRLLGGTHTTRWLRADLAGVQALLEREFPGDNIELVEWDTTVQRVLTFVHGPGHAGTYYVFDRGAKRLLEFARRSAAPPEAARRTSLHYSFAAPSGARLSGLVTFPATRHGRALPLMIMCPTEPWDRASPTYQAEVQAFAEMGFAVAQVNLRGAWGFGLAHRQALRDGGYEAAQAEDLLHTVGYLQQAFHINPARVALIGRDRGGYLALRALQLHPGRFRCAVVLQPTIDLEQWLDETVWQNRLMLPRFAAAYFGDRARLKDAALRRHPEQVQEPVMVLSYPGRDGTPRLPAYNLARNFTQALRRTNPAVEFADLSQDFVAGLPAARGDTFTRIQAFLFAHVFDYSVDVGPAEVRE